METPEGKLKKDIKEFLKGKAALVSPMSFGYGKKGVSDFIACYKGKFLAIEVKVKPRKPTKLQLNFLEEVLRFGGSACVAYDLKTVQEALQIIDGNIQSEKR